MTVNSMHLRWLAFPGISGIEKTEPQFWHIDSTDAPPAEGMFIALVPGTDAVVHFVSLPATLKGRAREAVAIRQVRDRLNAEAGTLQILPMRIQGKKNNWTSVLVVRAEDVREWRRCLDAVDARCRAILPDYLALPHAPGLWTVVTSAEAGRGLVKVRLGAVDGFTAEVDLAAFALTRARSTRLLPEVVLRLGPPEPSVDAALDGLPLVYSRHGLPKEQASAGVLLQDEEALDLRLDHRQNGAIPAATWRRLYVSAFLAAFGFVAWMASLELETRRYHAEADRVLEEVVSAARRDFLPTEPIVNMRVQIVREMERLQRRARDELERQGLLSRFRQISSILAAQHNLKVLSVVLREGEGMSIDISVPDFSVLESVAAGLREVEPGVRLLRSATEAENRVVGTFFIGAEHRDD